MKLIIYVNEHFEEEKALVDIDKKEVLLKGDWYHDKIDVLIEGYLNALIGFNIYTEEVDTEYIDSKHELYDYLEFYNEEDFEDDEDYQ